MKITLSEAARHPGAPSQPALHRMTKNKRIPGFLIHTGDGWRVDTGNEEWQQYLGSVSRRVLPQTLSGNHVKAVKRKIKPPARSARNDDDEDEDNEKEKPTSVQRAAEAKIIYNAQREKLKMEQDEIKTGSMKEEYVVKSEGQYWLSFIQREITDSFSVVRRCMSEVKRLILAGEDLKAEKYLLGELRSAFERTAKNLQDSLEGQDDDE